MVIGGTSEAVRGLPQGWVYDLVPDPGDPESVHARTSGPATIYRFDGTSWSATPIDGATVRKLALGGTTLYAATSHGLYRWSLSGGSWTRVVGAGASASADFVSASPGPSTFVYVVGRKTVSRYDAASGRWIRLPDAPVPLDSLKVDAADDRVLVGARSTRGGVFRFDGSRWEEITRNLPTPFMKEVHADPLYGGTYYVGLKCLGFSKLVLGP